MSENTETQPEEGMSIKFYLMILGGVSLAPILLFFLIGLGFAIFADPVPTSERIGSVRDLVIIVIFFEILLVIVAVTALVLQIARLVSTLRGELKPMIENTREATETVKGTASFVSKNVAAPIVTTLSVLAGLFTFLREIGGIRRAIRRTPREE